MIGEMPEEPAADRPHDEADRKQNGRVQLLYDGIVARKKRGCEIESKCRIDVEVVPLDEIADGTNEDGFQPALYIRKTQAVVFYADGNRSHGQRDQFGPFDFSSSATFATPAFAHASSCSCVEPELPTAPMTSLPI